MESTVDDVRKLVAVTLGIEDRIETLTASTGLLGSLPEFDSMAVVEVIAAIEGQFGIHIDDDEITGELFETLGDLATFVDAKRRG